MQNYLDYQYKQQMKRGLVLVLCEQVSGFLYLIVNMVSSTNYKLLLLFTLLEAPSHTIWTMDVLFVMSP